MPPDKGNIVARFALVFAGGAAGSALRLALVGMPPLGWMTASLVANVVACFAIGWLAAARPSARAMAFGATGFCGGLSTFSTLAAETHRLAADGAPALFAGLSVELTLGLLAVPLGAMVGRRR